MFQHLYDEWLTKLSEKAAHLSGLFICTKVAGTN